MCDEWVSEWELRMSENYVVYDVCDECGIRESLKKRINKCEAPAAREWELEMSEKKWFKNKHKTITCFCYSNERLIYCFFSSEYNMADGNEFYF